MSARTLNKAVERAIRRGTGADRIEEVDEVGPVWGGNGQVLRVELSGAPVDSVIVKHITVPPGAKRKKKGKDASLTRTLASYDNELHFYQQYGARLNPGVRRPHFYSGVKLEDGWVFVLEDLVLDGFSLAKREYQSEDIRAAMGWLAQFHATFLGHPGDGLWKAGSYWNLSARLEESGKMSHPKLKAAATSLDRALHQSAYTTLIHGDAKTDNFCFSQSGPSKVAGLDFQYTGQGCGMKDVMCFLDSCLPPVTLGAEAPDHLDHYFKELRHALARAQPSVDAALVEAEWRALYPVAWADYYRFLDGWAPGKYPPTDYIEEMLSQALHYVSRESSR